MASELLKTVGWAIFVGFGIAIGLALGSLGADVPADSEMLILAGLLAAAATFVVRLLLVVFRGVARPNPAPATRRPAGSASPSPGPVRPADDDLAPAPGATTARGETARRRPARTGDRPVRSGSARKKTAARKQAPKKTAAKKTAAKKRPPRRPND